MTDIDAFAARLEKRSATIDIDAENWKNHHGAATEEALRSFVPKDTHALEKSIRQVEPGGIEIGEDYWIYVDRGTVNHPPQPFVSPALESIRPAAVKDALQEGLNI